MGSILTRKCQCVCVCVFFFELLFSKLYRGKVEIIQSRNEWASGGERLAVIAEWTLDLTADETEQLVITVSLDNDAVG